MHLTVIGPAQLKEDVSKPPHIHQGPYGGKHKVWLQFRSGDKEHGFGRKALLMTQMCSVRTIAASCSAPRHYGITNGLRVDLGGAISSEVIE